MLTYFAVSLFIIFFSTIKVAIGINQPVNYLRFLLIFNIGGKMPQLLEFNNIALWLTHLSYRFYSMMMTTTVLGIFLALSYKPRTWCTICPISTVSDIYINK